MPFDTTNIFSLKENVGCELYEQGFQIISTYNSIGEFVSSRLREKLVLAVDKVKYGELDVDGETIVDLFKYVFPDGEVFYEVYQEFLYRNEDYLFLALKEASGDWFEQSLWTNQEMIDKINENLKVNN